MTVWVIRDGRLVAKNAPMRGLLREGFPAPHVSRMEPYESPVTGKEISTHREREAEMRSIGAYDPRDLPRDHRYRRGRAVQLTEAADARPGSGFEWRDRD
jgi:hypothetical protein